MTTTVAGTLEEIIRFTPTEQLELLAALVADESFWRHQGLCGRLATAALADGLISPEGRVTDRGYALAARYEEAPQEDQRLIVGGADGSVPGPFATPNVNARESLAPA